MKKLSITILSCVVVGGLSSSAQTLPAPALQFQASNYNPATGVWTDSSGNGDNATYVANPLGTQALPILVGAATPNGSATVDLNGNGSFPLLASIPYASGYTVFAFVEPTTGLSRNAITGGSAKNALEYDIYNVKQDYLTEYTSDIGHGTATVSTSGFSLVDLAVNSSSASFDLNGSSDGSVAGATFGAPITRIGNNEGGGDGFVGDISEIDIFSGVLTPAQISSEESALTAEYVTPVPEPGSLALLAGGSGLWVAWRRFLRA